MKSLIMHCVDKVDYHTVQDLRHTSSLHELFDDWPNKIYTLEKHVFRHPFVLNIHATVRQERLYYRADVFLLNRGVHAST